jgi:hypothetical protein
MMTNNILSYFIKDIKSAKERAFYKQINEPCFIHWIKIVYKDEILYEIKGKYCYNHINNIVKCLDLKYILNYNIWSNYTTCKNLYYKKDAKIKFTNSNYIRLDFTYNKYLQKFNFGYHIDNKSLLYISIIYFKKYKYIKNRNSNGNKFRHKFTSAMILIPNKYELQYYCKFFNLYFIN